MGQSACSWAHTQDAQVGQNVPHSDPPVTSVQPRPGRGLGDQSNAAPGVWARSVLQEFHVNFLFKDGKIEAEDFTSWLYRELNSSPRPYLVPFLKVTAKPVPSVLPQGGVATQWAPQVESLKRSRQNVQCHLGS